MGRLKEFTKVGHFPSLLASFLHFDVSFMVWVILGGLGVFIASDLHLSPGQKGLMVAIPVLSAALFRILLGVLTDYFGPKRVGTISMAVVLIPLVWGWLAGGSFTQILGIGILLGVAGASFAVALPLASRWYPPKYQGIAMGVAGAGNSGVVLDTLFAPRLASLFGWHAVFAIAMIPVLAVGVAYFILAKDSPEQPMPKGWADYAVVLKLRDTWLFCLFYSVTFGAFVGLGSFLPIFFHDQYKLPAVAAGTFTALCVFSGSFARPVGGYIADRIGGLRLLIGIYVAIVLLALGVSFLPALSLATSFLFFLMLVLGMGNGAVFQLVPQRFRREIGVMTGLVGAAGGLGGFVLPFMLGTLKGSTGTFASGFYILVGMSLLAFGVLLSVRASWQNSFLAPPPETNVPALASSVTAD